MVQIVIRSRSMLHTQQVVTISANCENSANIRKLEDSLIFYHDSTKLITYRHQVLFTAIGFWNNEECICISNLMS